MVKSSRPGAVSFEVNSQVNLLASQFSNSVRLGGQQASNSNGEQMMTWGSTSSVQPKANADTDSMMSITPAETQSGVQDSHPKYSAIGFEVDLSGSQSSDTPFLRPKVGNDAVLLHRKHFHAMLGVKKEITLKMKEDRFKKRRAQRLGSSPIVSRLLHSARQRLLTDLSLMVPGSIERIKRLDPSGNGELDWGMLQSWLEGQPELKGQMNLTTGALTLIATYKGPSVEARSLQALKLYAVVVCKLDPDMFKELCSFLFPEDNRFSPQGSC
ncbi:unnamed protein product [Calypogeia fissa]